MISMPTLPQARWIRPEMGLAAPAQAPHPCPLGIVFNASARITIAAGAARVYPFWSNFENFAYRLPGIVSVTITGDRTSHWIMKGSISTLEWDTEITYQDENRWLGWCSTAGSLYHSGQAQFKALPAHQTEVIVSVQYEPPPQLLAAIAVELFGDMERKLQAGLHAFKLAIEGRPEGATLYTCLA